MAGHHRKHSRSTLRAAISFASASSADASAPIASVEANLARIGRDVQALTTTVMRHGAESGGKKLNPGLR